MQNHLSGLDSELESAKNIFEDLLSDSQNYKKEIDELNDLNLEHKNSLISSRNLTYIALELSLFTVVKSMRQYPSRDSIER
jgi:hypothetical protein